MRDLIVSLLPPIIYNFLIKLVYGGHEGAFKGNYSSVKDIEFGNPWNKPEWINLSRKKLNDLDSYSGTEKFVPNLSFHGYVTLPALLINTEYADKSCKILDIGGGTGFVYFKIFDYLTKKDQVEWHVCDDNTELYKIGSEYASKKSEYSIEFREQSNLLETYDIVYINTSLQYIYEYESFLESLSKYQSKYIVLTRLLASDSPTFFVKQAVEGHVTACMFINTDELNSIMKKVGYELVFHGPCEEEHLEGTFEKEAPEEYKKIKNSLNFIYRKI